MGLGVGFSISVLFSFSSCVCVCVWGGCSAHKEITFNTSNSLSVQLCYIWSSHPISISTHMHSTSQTHYTHSSEKSSKTLLPIAQNNCLPPCVLSIDNIFKKVLKLDYVSCHPGAYQIIQLSIIWEVSSLIGWLMDVLI